MQKYRWFAIAIALMLTLTLLAQDTTRVIPEKEETPPPTPGLPQKGGQPIPPKQTQEPPKEKKNEFAGSKKCRICHKNEYDSWVMTPHAAAFDRLSVEEQRNDSCLACHVTGVDLKGNRLLGVQCESCHGAGSSYSKTRIMEDKKLSMENGMIEPTQEVCEKCHNDKSPTFKGFDFETAVKDEAAVHRFIPKSEEDK